MNTNNNPTASIIADREHTFERFREIYRRLDELIIALYRPSQYTLQEYEQLVAEYRILQPKADRMEEYIRRNFPHKSINEIIARMKSDLSDEDCGGPVI